MAVVVPARDEEESLPGQLDRLREAGHGYRVVVVDNGSTDRTAEVARSRGVRVVREPRAGYGRACRRGLEAVADEDPAPRVAAFLDADDRHGPGQLPRVVDPIRRGRADLVLGRRSPGDGVPLHAAAGNALVSAVLAGIYGWPGTDMGPLRAIRFRSLEALGLDEPHFGWNVQMLVRALRAGLRVRETPVRHEPRRRGSSKISGDPVAAATAGAVMLGTLVREVLRPRVP